ncbi:Tetratricopeptide repeat-containing protein [Nocardioides terrae]|uniref:Tetratricopeptide repeat-containing protein n=1 Tax=Nocardioides terrae TaxID=574651 RepID=A0A1I1P0Z8_9ACTN|nr:tetratricopeptide repeat protein [Nocardioides terrae]SFD03405.1 Tetratricopeptide repeat-containing protein [Nocardioides terrae]
MLRRLFASVALLVLVSTGLTACGDDEGDKKSSADAKAAAKLVKKGLDQLADGDPDAATTTFDKALDLDPKNAYAHYNLGYLAQQAGDDDAAGKEYDDALAALPTLTSALYNKAILLEDDDLDQAVALYRKALTSDPDNAAAHMRLGFALVHLGQKDEGAAELAQGLRLDPSMKSVPAPTYAD